MASIDLTVRTPRIEHSGDSSPDMDETLRRDLQADAAANVIGFRIMREAEIAPGWWGKPVEIGETVSGTDAFRFCDEQNAKTMKPTWHEPHRYFVEPIFSEPDTQTAGLTAPQPSDERVLGRLSQADEALRRVRGPVLSRFPAGDPRSERKAEQFAAEQRAAGIPADVVMDLGSDAFLVRGA